MISILSRTSPFLSAKSQEPEVVFVGKKSKVAGVSEKTRENRLRRLADRNVLRLTKSRSRNPDIPDFGLYALINPETGGAVNPALADRWACSWNIDQVEAYLKKRG